MKKKWKLTLNLNARNLPNKPKGMEEPYLVEPSHALTDSSAQYMGTEEGRAVSALNIGSVIKAALTLNTGIDIGIKVDARAAFVAPARIRPVEANIVPEG